MAQPSVRNAVATGAARRGLKGNRNAIREIGENVDSVLFHSLMFTTSDHFHQISSLFPYFVPGVSGMVEYCPPIQSFRSGDTSSPQDIVYGKLSGKGVSWYIAGYI